MPDGPPPPFLRERERKKEKKSRGKKVSKGYPRTSTLAEFKENFPDFFFSQYEDKRRNPFVQIHASGTKQIPLTYALNQPEVSQNSSPPDTISLLIATFGIHLEPGCKGHGQIIHFHTAIKNRREFFSIFSRILLT